MANRNKRNKRKERVVSASRRLKEHKSGGDRLAFNLPATVKQFMVGKEAKSFNLDFVPWTAGKGNPYAKPGEPAWERTYYCHPRVGPNNKTVICNSMTFPKGKNNRCYPCEYRAKLGQKPDPDPPTKKLIGDLYPKQRQAFLVIDRAERKKGLQLWEYSWHNFGKYLDNKIQTAKGEQQRIRDRFADPKQGCTLEITGTAETTGQFSYIKFADIQFIPRKKPIDPEVVNSAPCIDDLIKAEDYIQVKDLFLQTAQAEDKDDEDEEGADIEDEDTDEEDEDGDDDEGDSDDEDEDDDDDSDDEDESDSDDEDDDEDEEDEESSGDEDDEDSGDDEEDSDDEEEDAEPPCGVGDLILFKLKGSKKKGKVIKVIKDDEKVRVSSGGKKVAVDYDDVVRVVKAAKKVKKKKRNSDF